MMACTHQDCLSTGNKQTVMDAPLQFALLYQTESTLQACVPYMQLCDANEVLFKYLGCVTAMPSGF